MNVPGRLVDGMRQEEKNQLRKQVLEMFQHGYYSYMKYAYPADELMPLSCKGRYRGSEPNRGDIDDALGNFSLTLVDSLDTLAVLGMFDEFERAVRLVIQNVNFDSDIVVSVFETNIRMIGGLLGAHVAVKYVHLKYPIRFPWYRDELLVMAHDLGIRLLPAFNTTSGLPLPRVNLRYGIDLSLSKSEREKFTCTACAGTLILEWATLTRLTGNYIFEKFAHRSLDYLWDRRHRQSNLMGTVLNVHNGDWIIRESGIGAGIDSYYEYLFKAYVLLGEKNNDYLLRFHKHYESIMAYVQQGVAMVNVHMHQPYRLAKNHMDALLAFWPGLQVMTGDLKSAIELHEMLYQVVQKHNFLPEAFTTDYRIHWNSHPLRPEFVESTYFLYKATRDPHYLEVGRTIVNNLERHARVKCGYAALSDIQTGQHEDRMDSFVLAETFKYLYLLFDNEQSQHIDIEQFIFSTEAHLLPMNLVITINDTLRMEFDQLALTNSIRYDTTNHSLLLDIDQRDGEFDTDSYSTEFDYRKVCPSMDHLFRNKNSNDYSEQLRKNIRGSQDMMTTTTDSTRSLNDHNGQLKNQSLHRLLASEFSAGNPLHVTQLRRMGVQIHTMLDGRIQLVHTSSQAASSEDANDGLLFMQEMIELMKHNSMNSDSSQYHPLSVVPLLAQATVLPIFKVGSAQFGQQLHKNYGIFSRVSVTSPFQACSTLDNRQQLKNSIALVKRGDCMFIDKARYLEQTGVLGGIVIDHSSASSTKTGVSAIFSMTGDGRDDVHIPLVLMFKDEGFQLLNLLSKQNDLIVYMGDQEKILGGPKSVDQVTSELFDRLKTTTNFAQLTNLEEYMSVLTKVVKLALNDKTELDLSEQTVISTLINELNVRNNDNSSKSTDEGEKSTSTVQSPTSSSLDSMPSPPSTESISSMEHEQPAEASDQREYTEKRTPKEN
ncbi:unnamed protein product [Didymodactylos carnosus]|uniref:alpha-1,2-Mannosidase n=1 Tax=Didymodactylos carnosus TaxID=1234261 RepID=A0A814LZ52_9BILA|nr:unnamed protein product [Didymodactylos carnosus]CAF1071137.1 unnamed protein product [Didymodactylos carnosus]CAF3764508.1 unnamed protein product [Didymodactylos carnosus]CAF3838254.1 unnamed protein product [Didymodactylos carnosus]